jgi:hypothetical protein
MKTSGSRTKAAQGPCQFFNSKMDLEFLLTTTILCSTSPVHCSSRLHHRTHTGPTPCGPCSCWCEGMSPPTWHDSYPAWWHCAYTSTRSMVGLVHMRYVVCFCSWDYIWDRHHYVWLLCSVFCYQQMKLVSIVIAAHAAQGQTGVQRELMQPTTKLTKLNPSANFWSRG